MLRHLCQTLDGIILVHEHEASDDRVKMLIELHGSGVPDGKGNIGMVPANRARSGPLHCFHRSIDAENVPASADHVGRQKAYISAAAADVEDAHSRILSPALTKVAV